MASKRLQNSGRSLKCMRTYFFCGLDPPSKYLAPRFARSMATETSFESSQDLEQALDNISSSEDVSSFGNASSVLTTIYKFPEMEPLRFETYDSKHLYLPLRRDILHRAVVYEGDKTRQGTAQAKTRWEVHGSHRKVRPQKGSGYARLGTKQSPLIKGGGKSFGPRARDFATGLPRKIYDLAWRTALSWRYRRGQLIVCEDGIDLEYPAPPYAQQVFDWHQWGKEHGGTLIVTTDERTNLFAALEADKESRTRKNRNKQANTTGGRARTLNDVDVKDLLTLGRVVIEKSALDQIIRDHTSDLNSKIRSVI